MLRITTLLLLFFLFSPPVFAHPGNTASDGCHYCRTNCASWGEVAGARHCHGGSAPSYTPPPTFNRFFEGKTYYSQVTYDAALKTAFDRDHKEAVSNVFTDLLERAPSTAELNEWFSYSQDINAVESGIKSTSEYMELVFENEHKANIQSVYEEITGEQPSPSTIDALFKESDDISVIREGLAEAQMSTEGEVLPNRQSDADGRGGVLQGLLLLILGSFLGISYSKMNQKKKA